jgi:hypothetical protein
VGFNSFGHLTCDHGFILFNLFALFFKGFIYRGSFRVLLKLIFITAFARSNVA